MKFFKPIDKNIIMEYIESDLNVSEICTKYKIGRRRFLLSLDYYKMKQKSKEITIKNKVKKQLKITHSKLYEHKTEIIESYISGKENTINLAKKFNCSQDKILLFLKNNNVQVLTYNEKQALNKKNFFDNNIEEIKRLYCEDKLTCEKIGELYNLNRETIRKFLIEYNVELRDSPKFDGSKLIGSSFFLKYGTEEEKQKIKANMRKWNEDDIDEKLKIKNISRVSPIKNNSVTLQCNIDKHIWSYTPTKVMGGYGCPLCKNKTEKYINSLLNIGFNGVLHIDILHNRLLCKYNLNNKMRKIMADFIIKKNNKIVAVIEYNGLQHYQPFKFGNMSNSVAEEKFVRQKIRDIEIEKYCLSNNILFFTIDGRIYTLYNNNILSIINDITLIIRKNLCEE